MPEPVKNLIAFFENSPIKGRSDSLSTSTASGIYSPPSPPEYTVADAIDELASMHGTEQPRKEYIKKLDQEAVKFLGEDYEDEQSILLSELQITQITTYLFIHRQEIQLWFAENPNQSILRIGKKLDQQAEQFRFGVLPRTVEIHRVGDGKFNIYVAISQKLSTGKKEKKLSRIGTSKKVTRLILLNPNMHDDELKLLSAVTKVQKNTDTVQHELKIEKEVFGDNISVLIGTPYLSKDKKKSSEYRQVIRTSEYAAFGDLRELEPFSATRKDILSSDSNYRRYLDSEDSIIERLILEILNCLIKIHDAGYVHNDIKMDNILVYYDPKDQKVHARITDFGMTKKAGEYFEPVASFCYASPQVIQKHIKHETHLSHYFRSYLGKYPCYGHDLYMNSSLEEMKGDSLSGSCKDDMWALGVTIFKLITGEHPTKSNFEAELMPRGILSEHSELIRKLLAPTREERPTAAEALEIYTKALNALEQNRLDALRA